MDAKKIHHIRQAKTEEGEAACLQPDAETNNPVSSRNSEVMKFVRSIKQTVKNLQSVLDELQIIASSIP